MKPVRISLGILSGLFLLSVGVASLRDTQVAALDNPAEVSAVSPGYRVAIDPSTGQFVEPTNIPTDPAAKTQLDPLSQSAKGLVEQPSPVAGGGTMVNLQGRFQNTYTATTNADGETVIECDTDTNGEGE